MTTTVPLTYICSICGERSRDICVACTKDACHNHRCERCKRCSDCCGCDVPLSAADAEVEPDYYPTPAVVPDPDPLPDPEPLPEPEPWPSPEPEPDPFPAPEPQPSLTSIPESEMPAETEKSIAESLPELFRPDPKPTHE